MVNSIITGISQALECEFGYGYTIHAEEIRQGLEEPCFLITCLNPSGKRYPSERYLRNNHFAVQYFPKSKNRAYAEGYGAAERLMRCLEVVSALGGKIRGTDMHFEIKDGILHFFVSYNAFITYPKKEEDGMGELKTIGRIGNSER